MQGSVNYSGLISFLLFAFNERMVPGSCLSLLASVHYLLVFFIYFVFFFFFFLQMFWVFQKWGNATVGYLEAVI